MWWAGWRPLVSWSGAQTYRLFVTDGGWQKLRELMPDHDAAIAEHFSVLTEAEQRQLAGLLRKLYRARQAR
jgi:DNA-binding MarR family transcriptional regulator